MTANERFNFMSRIFLEDSRFSIFWVCLLFVYAAVYTDVTVLPIYFHDKIRRNNS